MSETTTHNYHISSHHYHKSNTMTNRGFSYGFLVLLTNNYLVNKACYGENKQKSVIEEKGGNAGEKAVDMIHVKDITKCMINKAVSILFGSDGAGVMKKE
eukprot:553508_1